MKQVTVFCKVGRADPQALATYPDNAACDAACAATESAKFADLMKSGVAPDRIEFSRVTTDAGNGDKKGGRK